MKTYSTPPADDRETPLVALLDISRLLSLICTPSNTSVYDPYYCKGAMKDRLESCGFSKEFIYNDNVDCYIAQRNKTAPNADIIISNPPFSSDHIRRAITYAVKTGKPWALLLPAYICLRPWFNGDTNKQRLLYLIPHERYSFEVHDTDAEVHTPLTTMWYIGGLSESQRERLIQSYSNSSNSTATNLNLKGIETSCTLGVAQNRVTLADSIENFPKKIRKLMPYMKNKALEIKRKSSAGKRKHREISHVETIGTADTTALDSQQGNETGTVKKRKMNTRR